MKTIFSVLQKRSLIVLAFLLLPYLSVNANDEVKCSPKQIDNLIRCIETGNEGVRKSAIFLAGKYKIVEVSEILLKILKEENNSSIVLLATFALYQIDEQQATFAVIDRTVENPDEELNKKLMQAVVELAGRRDNIWQ